jgi:hypothetical protein
MATMIELITGLERAESALEGMVSRSMNIVGDTKDAADSAIESVLAVRERISDAMLKRSDENIRAVYEKYAKNEYGICKNDFLDALYQVRLEAINREDADVIFDNMDMDNSGQLDSAEFRRAVSARSSFEQFITHAIPFSELISTSLPRKNATNQMTTFMELTSTQISVTVSAVSTVLESILTAKARELRESYKTAAEKVLTDQPSASKFSELTAGVISDYHNGLSGRVGKQII